MADIRESTLEFGDGADTLEVSHWSDGFNFQINSDWYGSTETGFGATLTVRLSAEQAIELAAWLLGRAELSRSSSEGESPSL